jgi:hypothetical protein
MSVMGPTTVAGTRGDNKASRPPATTTPSR